MNPFESNEPKLSLRRLYGLAVLLLAVLACYVGVLFDTQINKGEDYLEKSVRTITNTETVEASRGILTDRNGRVLVSNRQTYALTFDASLLDAEDDVNAAILRLIHLCRQRGVSWNDSLPLSQSAPYSYQIDEISATQRSRFLKYLQKSLKKVSTNVKSEDLTGQLLSQIIPAPELVSAMRESFGIPSSWNDVDARAVLGVQYELAVRKLVNTTAYVFAEDVDTDMISLINDGDYRGVKVISSSIREYETDYAAHILGTVGRIGSQEELDALGSGYAWDDLVGKSGVEAAFESYLKGTDGKRVVSTNADGKITGEYYSTQPQPGNTVALTLDLELQQAVESAMAKTISKMNAEDGDRARGGAAAVVKVDSGEVLSLASYPTFSLLTYRQDYDVLNADPSKPLFNRATNGTYPPGSTFKPLTAIAALQEGKVTLTEKINDTGKWFYPDMIEGAAPFGYWCWKRSGHGRLDVTGAINNSCNYFFCEMGYRLGIDLLDQYALAFGLGEKTGIEIGEKAGTLAGPEERQAGGGTWYGGDTVQAAYGQSDHLFTPIQLANYIATLVNGGKHYQAHLLKSAKTYDNSAVVAVGGADPINTIEISEANLNAVKAGMHDLTTTGSLAGYFRSCVVDAGAKTGTAQLGANATNNGVFVCFAPYENPEIALAIVIEHGGSGAALASTAVDILNAYFTQEEIGTIILGEQQLLN